MDTKKEYTSLKNNQIKYSNDVFELSSSLYDTRKTDIKLVSMCKSVLDENADGKPLDKEKLLTAFDGLISSYDTNSRMTYLFIKNTLSYIHLNVKRRRNIYLNKRREMSIPNFNIFRVRKYIKDLIEYKCLINIDYELEDLDKDIDLFKEHLDKIKDIKNI